MHDPSAPCETHVGRPRGETAIAAPLMVPPVGPLCFLRGGGDVGLKHAILPYVEETHMTAAGEMPDSQELDQAETAWRAAAEGGDAQAMNALGALLAMRGDLDGAETWLRCAIASGVRDAHLNLGRLLEIRGD